MLLPGLGVYQWHVDGPDDLFLSRTTPGGSMLYLHSNKLPDISRATTPGNGPLSSPSWSGSWTRRACRTLTLKSTRRKFMRNCRTVSQNQRISTSVDDRSNSGTDGGTGLHIQSIDAINDDAERQKAIDNCSHSVLLGTLQITQRILHCTLQSHSSGRMPPLGRKWQEMFCRRYT